jgi:hypothetical protein
MQVWLNTRGTSLDNIILTTIVVLKKYTCKSGYELFTIDIFDQCLH